MGGCVQAKKLVALHPQRIRVQLSRPQYRSGPLDEKNRRDALETFETGPDNGGTGPRRNTAGCDVATARRIDPKRGTPLRWYRQPTNKPPRRLRPCQKATPHCETAAPA